MKRIKSLCLFTSFLLVSLLHAQVSRVELRSLTGTGSQRWDFNVYLPPEYDNTTERFPVVYLFRGAVDEWLDRTEDGSRNGRNIQSIIDTLIAQGKMGGVILVMPGFTAMTGAATEADYSFILNTLIPYIDQNYRTLPSRWFRGLDGFSLGGLHMVNLIWRNPERFASAGSYDGTFSLFSFSQMTSAGEPYFARLRPIQFLLHSAAVAQSNLSTNRQFENLLVSYGIHNAFDNLLFSSTSQHNWWYADEHMIRALPLHWSKFQIPPHNVALSWKSSIPPKAAGTVRLAWSIGLMSDSLKTLIEFSKDAGETWKTLLFSSRRDSTYDWNTLNDADGTGYLVRVKMFGDTSYGMTQSLQRFTIDNPGNSPPDIVSLSPNKGERISGSYNIRWTAEDPEGDPIQVTIFGSSDRGASWQIIAANLQNSGSYQWYSQLEATCLSFQLKLSCSDGSKNSEIISQPFEVFNARNTISTVKHIAGTSDGQITVSIADPSKLTGHTYRIYFDDTSSDVKRYNIQDKATNVVVLRNTPFIGDGSEGPLFDGIRLSVLDYPAAKNNRDSTRWTRGTSTLTTQISIPTIFLGADTIRGVAYPSDYEIRIADRIVDTSKTLYDAPATLLYYKVWNTSENHKVDVLVTEFDGDGIISRFDYVYILEKDRTGASILTWRIFFSGDEKTILPTAGDVFTVKTIKPIRSNDMYEFAAIATEVLSSNNLLQESPALFQNYPNPFNPQTKIEYEIHPSPFYEKGERGGFVSLKVFDLLGREVAVLVDEVKPAGRYRATWNAKGFSSGIYFYRLHAGSFVETKKLMLLK
ncbi:MAG: alpha/beta hydrolase-fold protein [bacterium]